MEGQIGQLPEWAGYGFTALGTLCGMLILFVLGLIAYAVKQRRGPPVPDDDVGQRVLTDCGGCRLVERLEERFKLYEGRDEATQNEIRALCRSVENLTGRIDRILEIRAGG